MKRISPALSCFTVLFLLTSQLAVGQTAQKAKPRRNAYETLFALTAGIAAQTKAACKTEACSKAADELAVVIADGKEKHGKGILVAETRKQFHADFRASMRKLRTALADNLSDEDKAAMQKGPACTSCAKLKTVQNPTAEECHLCWDVLEIASGICTLYVTCPTCQLICLAAAALQFGNCIERWCQTDPGGYYNDN